MRPSRRHLVHGWIVVGLAGSLALTAADSELLNHKPIRWWFSVHLGSRDLCHHVFWAGLLTVCVAWLGLGWRVRGKDARGGTRPLLIAGALWALPVVLGPALASGDMFSYLAQGDLLRVGINPYHHGPEALRAAHQMDVLRPVSRIWRHTAAPYGPLFVGVAAVVAWIAGSHLVLGLLLLRTVELVGLGLLAVFVPRLARQLGADPARAVWLVVISPLILVDVIGGGHNDALMAGLLVAGVSYAVARRPLTAIALCTLAATVKLPAAVAVVLIVACWLREPILNQVPVARARILTSAALVVAVVVTLVGLITTVGFSWISSGLLSGPAQLRVAITPGTAAGYSLHSLFAAGGSSHPLEHACIHVALALTAVVGLWLLARVRYDDLPRYLGIVLLVTVFGGPISWPWYLVWGIALLAVDRRAQRWMWLPALIIVAAFLIRPNGIAMVPITDAPYTFALYLATLALLALRLGGGPPRDTLPRTLQPRPLELGR